MDSVVNLLRELVRIPSMNPMGRARSGKEYSEEHLAHFVADYLKVRRIDAKIQEIVPHRPNVLARIDAGAARTVLLEAHLDTVHADAMMVPPFEGRMVDGRLQGRGACDTKGALAAFMDAVCSLVEERKTLRYNILLAAVADEEYGFTGAKAAVAGGLRADFGVCGEPTGLRIITAHKGVVRWRIRTTGRAAHSAYPERGQNAIYAMGGLLVALEDYASRLGRMRSHPYLGGPTLSVGVIEGGQAVNIVPDSCWIEVDRRTLPGETTNGILEDVRAVLGDLPGWSMDPPHLEAPGMENSGAAPELERLQSAIGAVRPVIMDTAQYATDAGIYAGAGIPCIVFGPGDIADAHTADESIDVSELVTARDIIRRFLT